MSWSLSDRRRATLAAVLDRILPTDDERPGARELGVLVYIERSLDGDLSHLRDVYETGLDAIDDRAHTLGGCAFAELEPQAADELLEDIELGRAQDPHRERALDDAPAAEVPADLLMPFWWHLLGHVVEGAFGDPRHGGNTGFRGWTMIGYPGPRLIVTAEEQEFGPIRHGTPRSGFDYPIFTDGSSHEH